MKVFVKSMYFFSLPHILRCLIYSHFYEYEQLHLQHYLVPLKAPFSHSLTALYLSSTVKHHNLCSPNWSSSSVLYILCCGLTCSDLPGFHAATTSHCYSINITGRVLSLWWFKISPYLFEQQIILLCIIYKDITRWK